MAVEQAAVRYFKTSLVVGSSGSGKTKLLKQICRQTQIPLINLGIELSQKLLPLTTRERKLKTCEIVSELIDARDVPRLAKEVLSDLSKVPLRLSDLKTALFPNGSPTTPSEFRNCFENFFSGLLKGKDAGKTRIVLE